MIAVIRPHWVVVSVGVVLKRRIADAKASPNDCLFRCSIGKANSRGEVGIAGLQTEVRRIGANTRDHKGVRGGIVIGKASSALGRCRGIEFPADSQIRCQLRGDLPFVAGEGEEPPLPESGEIGVEISPYLLRHIQEKAGHFVGDIGLSAGLGGIIFRERDGSARTERLVLEKIVMNSPDVGTKFDGVVANDLSPVVYAIDVGFRTYPGK